MSMAGGVDLRELVKKGRGASRPVVFGEVLFDVYPDGSEVLGGAPFNVAWHLQALGEQPLIVSRVGQDDRGDRVLREMADWGMDQVGIQRDSGKPTGRVRVKAGETGEPAFEIPEDQAFDHIDSEAVRAVVGTHPGGLLYFGSLALRNEVSANALSTILESSDRKVFADLNLRSPWWSHCLIDGILQQANYLKLNAGELTCIWDEDLSEPASAARELLRIYGLEAVFVTRGEAGALEISADGGEVEVGGLTQSGVVDTVGAGDAFSAVAMLGLQHGWPITLTLDRANRFAAALCSIRGAITPNRALYAGFADSWSSPPTGPPVSGSRSRNR